MTKRQWYIAFTVFCIIMGVISMYVDSILLVLLFLSLIVLSIIQTNRAGSEEARKDIDTFHKKVDEIIEKNQFTKSQIFVSSAYKNAIFIDEKKSILGIIRKKSESILPSFIPFSNIMESEIIQNEISVTKTARGSQLGGALIGGMLAGGIGAAVGGLSGKRTSEEEIKKIQLQIVTDDLNNPVHKMTFLDLDKPVKTNEEAYIQISEKAMHWHKLLSVIIKRNDRDSVTIN